MWFKKLKRKKVQYMVISLIFIFITAIFTGCVCFAVGMTEFSSTFYSKNSNPEFYYASTGKEGIEALKNYSDQSGDIRNLFIQEGRALNTKIKINDKNLELFQSGFFAMEDTQQMPYFFKGKGSIADLSQPKEGTVWIAEVFADLKGVKPGDVMKVKSAEREYEFEIGGTYLASICPSTSMAYYPFYLNPSDIAAVTDASTAYFTTMDKTEKALENSQFRTMLPTAFLGSIDIQYDLSSLHMSLSSVTTLMAGLGSMASLLIFLVSIVIIRFIIKSNMVKEYKSIGVYKSLGFSSGKIIGFYYNCYLFSGVISIVVGILLGIPLALYLGRLSVRYLGNYSISTKAFLSMGAGAVLLIAILTLNVYLSLRKVKKINPVRALTMEMASSRSKLKKSLIPNAHSSLSMAVNDIFKKKGQSFLIMLILVIAFYLSIFFSMTNYTIRNIQENSSDWFTLPNTKCFVSMEINKDTEKIIAGSIYVDKVTFGQLLLFIPVKMAEGENTISDCTFYSYSDFSQDITGVKYREGRPPEGTGEIAASTLTLKNMNVRSGDYVKLDLDGHKKEFLITGQYDTMMNGGLGLQIPNAALEQNEVAYKNTIGFVKLKNQSDFDAFRDEIKQKLPEAEVTKSLTMLTDATKSVSELVVPITTILVSIFMAFSFLNIINLLLIHNIENRKRFGILKALGFTDGYIILQSMFKIILLSVTAIVGALALHAGISRQLFQALISIDGLLNNATWITGLLSVMLLLVLVTALLFTIPLTKIRPVDLMEE